MNRFVGVVAVAVIGVSRLGLATAAESQGTVQTADQVGRGDLAVNTYKPPLTRPADFQRFWDHKLAELRAVPFDDVLTEAPDRGNATYAHYDLAITLRPGERVETFLRVPKAKGVYDAEVCSYWGSTPPEKLAGSFAKWERQPIGHTQWRRGATRIRVGAPQIDDAKYNRWTSKDDNNYLDNYLLSVRMADYLRARNDVRGIYLFGASRSGPIAIVTAALDPTQIVAVDVHVPTSCGLSLKDTPYRGWGNAPARRPGAAYFDPMNHAPDLTVPILIDCGDRDGLSPAPGIVATANWAANSPWVRCSVEKGGHGYFRNNLRPRMREELAAYLKTAPPPQKRASAKAKEEKKETDPERLEAERNRRADKRAAKLMDAADGARDDNDYARAHALYDIVRKRYPGTEAAATAEESLERLRKNATAMAKIQRARAARECRGLMSLARNYARSGMNDRASSLLKTLIARHPETSFAGDARAMLRDLGQ